MIFFLLCYVLDNPIESQRRSLLFYSGRKIFCVRGCKISFPFDDWWNSISARHEPRVQRRTHKMFITTRKSSKKIQVVEKRVREMNFYDSKLYFSFLLLVDESESVFRFNKKTRICFAVDISLVSRLMIFWRLSGKDEWKEVDKLREKLNIQQERNFSSERENLFTNETEKTFH